MAERTSIELPRGLYEAFGEGDVETMRRMISDDTVWHIAGRNRIAGDCRGIEEVFEFFATVDEMTDGTFHLEVHDIAGSDDLGIALVTARARRDGKDFEARQVPVNRWEDGELTEVWNVPEDQYTYDQLWA